MIRSSEAAFPLPARSLTSWQQEAAESPAPFIGFAFCSPLERAEGAGSEARAFSKAEPGPPLVPSSAWAHRARGGGRGQPGLGLWIFFRTLEIPRPKRYRRESGTFPRRAGSKTRPGIARGNQRPPLARKLFKMPFSNVSDESTAGIRVDSSLEPPLLISLFLCGLSGLE